MRGTERKNKDNDNDGDDDNDNSDDRRERSDDSALYEGRENVHWARVEGSLFYFFSASFYCCLSISTIKPGK